MSFLLDTDICSAILRGHPKAFARSIQHSGRLYLSTITQGELLGWVRRKNSPMRRQEAAIEFIRNTRLLDVDRLVAEKFGDIRADLLDRGRPKAKADLFIAATALVHDLTLVTHNISDFEYVPTLKLVDWIDN